MPTEERGKRAYRDLKGRTTRKYRQRRSDRIPGDQFDPEKALDEFDVPSEEEIVDVPVEEVDVVEQLAPKPPHKPGPRDIYHDEPDVVEYTSEEEMLADFPEMAGDGDGGGDGGGNGASAEEVEAGNVRDKEGEPEKTAEEEPEVATMEEEAMPKENKEPEVAMDEKAMREYMDAPEVAMDEVEVLDEAEAPEEAAADDEKEACMTLKKGEDKEAATKTAAKMTFADLLRKAMEPEEELTMDLGEEMMEAPDQPAGPCPPGCEPLTEEEEPEEGILEVDEGDVEIVDDEEDKKEAVVSAEEEEEEDKDKKEAAVEADAAPESTDVVYETIGDIESYANVNPERVDLFLTNEETDNPHYVVMIDGDPVAKVAFADQPDNPQIRDLFMMDEYPNYVIKGIGQFGLDDMLNTLNARPYSAKASSGEVAAQMKQAATVEMEADYRKRMADTKDALLNTANIVLQGSLKNYILDNPLRDALVSGFRSAGVDENYAIDIIEEAFREVGQQYFANVLAKAEEWLGAPEGVLDHHIKEITAMPYRHPGYVRHDDEIAVAQTAPPSEPVEIPANVPLRTVSSPTSKAQEAATRQAATQGDTTNWRAQKAVWQRQLNLGGRMAEAAMSNFRTPKKW